MIQSKNILVTGLTIALLLLFGVGQTSTLYAKSYTIPVIKVDVQVLANGNVRITEHRSYQFDGSYSWADYRLPLQGYEAISNIQVSENGQSLSTKTVRIPVHFWCSEVMTKYALSGFMKLKMKDGRSRFPIRWKGPW